MKEKAFEKEVFEVLLEYGKNKEKSWFLYEVLAGVILKRKYNEVEVGATFDFFVPSLNAYVEVKKYPSVSTLSFNQKQGIFEGKNVYLIVPSISEYMKRNVVEEVIWHEKLLDYNFYLIKKDLALITAWQGRKTVESHLVYLRREEAKEDIKKLLDSFFK